LTHLRKAKAFIHGPPTDLRGPERGVRLRLLECDTCHAVWPTERSPEHGGSRQDGDPCAYTWGGRVCRGRVFPYGVSRGFDDDATEAPADFVFRDAWCDVLAVPWGTRDLALVRSQFRALAKQRHPDVEGGSHQAFLTLYEAYRRALSELGQPL
jgi:hypothetical protein